MNANVENPTRMYWKTSHRYGRGTRGFVYGMVVGGVLTYIVTSRRHERKEMKRRVEENSQKMDRILERLDQAKTA